MEAQDWALALRAFAPWSSRLVSDGELMTVERWYDALPIDVVTSRPDLVVTVTYALVFLRRNDKVAALEPSLLALRGSGHVSRTTDPDFVLSMATIFEDDVESAARIADKPDLHDGDERGFAAFELGAAANLLSFASMARGRLAEAHKLLSVAERHNAFAGAPFSGGYTAALIKMAHLVTLYSGRTWSSAPGGGGLNPR